MKWHLSYNLFASDRLSGFHVRLEDAKYRCEMIGKSIQVLVRVDLKKMSQIQSEASLQCNHSLRSSPHRVLLLVSLCIVFATCSVVGAQDPSSTAVDPSVLADLVRAANEKPAAVELAPAAGLDFLSLLLKGGWFMIPIALVSILAVTLIIERSFGLRRGQLLPRRLIKSLGRMARDSDSVDPRTMNTVCQEHPSAASTVLRSMLLKVGRPASEMQTSVTEVLQREAEKAHASVRWLNFAAAVAPLLGLLGTVWGLIQAFHDMTQLSPSQNRAEYLGRGIYEALVTTLAGLIVAIPAALAAHYFEGRITKIFREIEEIVYALMPKFEKYEGRVRFDAIGRELVPRSIEPRTKAASAPATSGESKREPRKVSSEVTPKPVSVPPVQSVARKEPVHQDGSSPKS